MNKTLYLLCAVLMSFGVYAQTPTLDVVMKEMALSYKNARKAPDSDSLNVYITEMQKTIVQAREIGFKQKQLESLKGLAAVETLLIEIKQNSDDLAKAKKMLNQVDELRKRYHKLHEPSIWQLLFG